MLLATAALDARAGRRIIAAAIAVAVQGALYWLILREAIQPLPPPTATPLEVAILTTARRARPLALPHKRRPAAPQRQAVPTRQTPPPAAIPQPSTLPREAGPAPRAAIDWRRAVQDEVHAAESGPRTGKLQFGFSGSPPGPTAAPEFGWDYAQTHRIVPLPHGGMIINLSDRCALNVWFPIPMCQWGKLPVNGQLLDNLHGSWNDRTDGLP